MGVKNVGTACAHKPVDFGEPSCIEYIGQCPLLTNMRIPKDAIWTTWDWRKTNPNAKEMVKVLLGNEICHKVGRVIRCGKNWTSIDSNHHKFFQDAYICDVEDGRI